jgi:hypothetical protein
MTSNTDAKSAAQSYAGEKLMEAARAKIEVQGTVKPANTAPVNTISDHKAAEAEIERSDAERNRVMREEYFAAKAARQAQGEAPAAVDVHGSNKRVGAVLKVDAGVVSKAEVPTPTISLHPAAITHGITEYEEHADLLAPAFRAFETAYAAVDGIFKAREAAAANPEWTPATQTIKTAEYALKVQEKATKAWDLASSNLTKAIAATEGQLSKPLETQNQTVTTAALAAEIRAHVKSMDQPDRQKFMREAFNSRDVRTLQAVLSGPSYLSGLDMNMHDHFVRQFHEMQQPQLVGRLNAMKKALELLDARGPLIWSEVTRAVGADWEKVNKMKAASTAAHAALIFNDLA